MRDILIKYSQLELRLSNSYDFPSSRRGSFAESSLNQYGITQYHEHRR